MKHALEVILDRTATWSAEAQAELIAAMIEIEERHYGVYRLSDEERAAVRRGLEESRKGNIASDEEVERVFARYRGE